MKIAFKPILGAEMDLKKLVIKTNITTTKKN
jgi:hypothetical protein